MDVVVAGAMLLLTSPVLLVAMGLVRVRMGRPALFRQVRPGLGGAPFEVLKLRTMRDAVDPQGRPLPDTERLTSLGKFLRNTSIDELPQLWNVLRGDMSLVGPRPLLVEYLPLYSPDQARRHEVRPGITGWAQVNGRNAVSWEEKFAMDVWYVDNRSVRLDIVILFRTLSKVFRREGVTQHGSVTTERFTGNAG
jgi:lipopolysaccharide/colanic/teichoic acid biosynthesis glycosyltransferase